MLAISDAKGNPNSAPIPPQNLEFRHCRNLLLCKDNCHPVGAKRRQNLPLAPAMVSSQVKSALPFSRCWQILRSPAAHRRCQVPTVSLGPAILLPFGVDCIFIFLQFTPAFLGLVEFSRDRGDLVV